MRSKIRWILINEKDEPVDPEDHLEEALEDAVALVEVLKEKLGIPTQPVRCPTGNNPTALFEPDYD